MRQREIKKQCKHLNGKKIKNQNQTIYDVELTNVIHLNNYFICSQKVILYYACIE